MSEQRPTLSARYYLTLEESQDGFALITFGKKPFTRFLTPAISIAIILWGIYLGFTGVGRYYVALGVFFLIMQAIMRFWLLPLLFKRQFVRYQFGKSEQGIDLYQDHFELYAAGKKQTAQYNEVQSFIIGKLTYMLELKTKTVVIIPKRVFSNPADQSKFENSFKK
ncbi:YcxB family protein [Acinetobacter sp. NIPH 2699]|uniref:YcxB family protein n=1 Tax=Acinetobacter sp. NIPH 2699 TaxID=2923433 RepID=UPI001F4C2AF1|nr:YcxB family protein [Acinetobacter sp. NIPH 2699]MCH7337760.1 YcxB family protein [Acinetobacter sp. NIPH 2699]